MLQNGGQRKIGKEAGKGKNSAPNKKIQIKLVLKKPYFLSNGFQAIHSIVVFENMEIAAKAPDFQKKFKLKSW